MQAENEVLFDPPEDLDLDGFAVYIDRMFGDINFEPDAKTAAQYVDLVPGDHVAVEVPSTGKLKIWHHGIFVGKNFNKKVYDEDMVVDNSKSKKELSVTRYRQFGGNCTIYRIDYDHDDDKKRLQRACMKAKWALNNPHKFKYQPIGNNCQHFAMWCSTLANRQVNIDLLPHYTSTYLDDKRRAFFFAGEPCDRIR